MKNLPLIMLLLIIMVACNRSAGVDGTPFRNATWGMTIEEVQATEPDFDGTTAVYSSTSGFTTVSQMVGLGELGVDWEIRWIFSRDEDTGRETLVAGYCLTDAVESHVYSRRLKQARRLLKQQYGSAEVDERTSEARLTKWDLPDGTRVELVGWSDGRVGHVAINYDSPATARG